MFVYLKCVCVICACTAIICLLKKWMLSTHSSTNIKKERKKERKKEGKRDNDQR